MFLSVSALLLGLKLVESYPYEAVQRDYDYVRLASISAGKSTRLTNTIVVLALTQNSLDLTCKHAQ